MKLRLKSILLVALGAPAWAAGQNGISRPVLGYMLESGAAGVRPVLGVPGAALLGARRPLGFEAALAQVSPRQDYVLAAGADGVVRLVAPDTLQARAVDGAMASPERLLLSPTGSAALLLGGGAAQILTGLPGEIAVADLDLAGLPGAPGAMAVADDGAAVLAAAGGGLFLLTHGGPARAMPSGGAISALAFAPRGRDAVAAGAGFVAVLRDVTGRPAWRSLPGAADDLSAPVGVAMADRRAYAADAAGVVAVDLASGAAGRFPCECTVTGLLPLAGEAIFRLNEPSAGAIWVFQDAAPQARLLFIPPDPEVKP